MRTLILLIAALGTAAGPARKPTVACTLPILEVLAREVGGDDFDYFSLAKPDQDPHSVRATPVVQRKLMRADLLLEVGMQLERWADLAAKHAPRVQRGRARIVVSRGIPPLQVPTELTRAKGHIHPEGNPHVWLDPVRTKQMASTIARALGSAAPDRRDAVDRRLKDFHRRIDRALYGEDLLDLVGAEKLDGLARSGKLLSHLETEKVAGEKLIDLAGGWLKKTAPLRGRKVVEFHFVWIYTADRFGFEIVDTIEEKPGIPPGPSHQAALTRKIRDAGVAAILVDNFYNPGLPKRISADTGCPVVLLPNQPGGEPGTGTYFEFMDHVLGKMVEATDR